MKKKTRKNIEKTEKTKLLKRNTNEKKRNEIKENFYKFICIRLCFMIQYFLVACRNLHEFIQIKTTLIQ